MNAQHKVVRINNYLLSFGINNSSTWTDDDVAREPTGSEYDELIVSTDDYFNQVFQNSIEKLNCGTFVKLESKAISKSFNTENIPNDKYQICIRYSYMDIYFTKDSALTDDIEKCPEGIIAKAIRTNKFLEAVRMIGNGETPFRATENVYFGYLGKTSS